VQHPVPDSARRPVQVRFLAFAFALALALSAASARANDWDLPQNPDPCVQAEFEFASSEPYILPEVRENGIVYWPDVRELPRDTPLIVLRHGNGQFYLNYNQLLEHLAKNGFVAASVEGPVDAIFAHFDWLKDRFGLVDDVPMGLIGHSRGGKVMTDVAQLNVDLGRPHRVVSMMGLAPADSDRLRITGSMASSYFVLLGSWDEDTCGWGEGGLFSPPTEETARSGTAGHGSYDRAGFEGSTDGGGILSEPLIEKAMAFVYGANHNYWRGLGLGTTIPHTIGKDDSRTILDGYAMAWFAWKMRGRGVYRGMFTGDWKPATVQQLETSQVDGWGFPEGMPIRIYTQYSAKFRRVVAHFETNDFVLTGDGVTAAVDASHELDYRSPHDTRALRVLWDGAEPLQYLRFTIPSQGDLWTGNKRDVSDFGYLSFRAGQIYDTSCGELGDPPCGGRNPFGEPQDFFVVLQDEDGMVFGRKLSQFGETIPFADHFYNSEPAIGVGEGNYSKSAMNTVRIPLAAYRSQVDLERIEHVIFQFLPGTTGDVLLDSVEFCD